MDLYTTSFKRKESALLHKSEDLAQAQTLSSSHLEFSLENSTEKNDDSSDFLLSRALSSLGLMSA